MSEYADLKTLADDFRQMGDSIERMAKLLESIEKSPEGQMIAFLEAAVAVARDGYQPRQATLQRLRKTYYALPKPVFRLTTDEKGH